MKTGLLWFDGDPKKGLEQKIGEAVARYREKFGAAPNTCFVHPKDLNSHGSVAPRGIRVVAASNILRNHFWVGWDDEAQSPAA